jgi:hypothetical protein
LVIFSSIFDHLRQEKWPILLLFSAVFFFSFFYRYRDQDQNCSSTIRLRGGIYRIDQSRSVRTIATRLWKDLQARTQEQDSHSHSMPHGWRPNRSRNR